MIERVLVVDDEPIMRSFTAETLQRMGKEVITAANGQEAIDFAIINLDARALNI